MAHKTSDGDLPIIGSPNVTVRPPKRSAPSYSERAEARMIRQKLLEMEQEFEEQEALKNHPEEMRILRESVASVKAEFSPLDGQSWDTPAGREELARHAQRAAQRKANHTPSPARLRASRLTSRRSRSSLRSSTVFTRSNITSQSAAVPPGTANVSDLSREDDCMIFDRPTTPLPPDLERDLARTPLPSVPKAHVYAQRPRTVLFGLEREDHSDDSDDESDVTLHAELRTPKPRGPESPKAVSTVPQSSNKQVSPSPHKSSSRLPRPTRSQLVPPRGHTVSSSARPPVFSRPDRSALVAAASSSGSASTSTTLGRRPSLSRSGHGDPAKTSSPPKSRNILSSSRTLNRGSVFSHPSSSSSTSTKARSLPSQGKLRPQAAFSSSATRKTFLEPRVESFSVKKSVATAPKASSQNLIAFPRAESEGPAGAGPSSAGPSAPLPRRRNETLKAPLESRSKYSTVTPQARTRPKN
ncbi:hypothetical protein L226DRAFT_617256 [Lentinus tigrinus ALCF2SS1-7]|uniref:Uncharacterized protein n=1 Tax=Lentinus tigrinus ALCF2SS1-6 TaxID=1328759 RepID=A0A5C2RRU1_9APHY|nr:hypothetical protein L227DRAFT_657964 [Lentinus tigrinus ALCF2SS1-6]RPD68789.1 hypothetical protein L226DRAFT_617256 [Lentinus tigrinus ALCF2SS1-7]